jgi:hypothetical protein
VGLSGSGELGQAVVVEEDGLTQLLLQGGAAAEGVGELLAEVVELLAVGSAVDGSGSGVGLTVEGLTRDAALVGESGDVAVVAEKDGGGAGEGGRGW